MIIIIDNNYSNPYDENNDNQTKIKESIRKIIKVLLTCVAIKTTITEAIKILITTIIIITVIIILDSCNL